MEIETQFENERQEYERTIAELDEQSEKREQKYSVRSNQPFYNLGPRDDHDGEGDLPKILSRLEMCGTKFFLVPVPIEREIIRINSKNIVKYPSFY
jgi:hypothetical protein